MCLNIRQISTVEVAKAGAAWKMKKNAELPST